MKQLLLIILIFMHSSLFAIVTIKPLDIGENKPGTSGEVTFSWKYNSGNTNTDSISSGVYVQQDYNNSLVFLKASYDTGESLGITYMDKSFVHGRRIHKLSEHLDDEQFMQQQSDTFQSLTSRTLAGAGLRIHHGEANKTGRFYFAMGAFYLTELEIGLPEVNYTRGNLYISYKYAPNTQYTFSLVSYYQPRFGQLNDYLQFTTAEFTIALSKTISLKISTNYNVNSDPADGVVPYDYSQTTALTYKF